MHHFGEESVCQNLTSAPSNAAPEWQAGISGWRRREMMVASPLEGLVRSVETLQATPADLRLSYKKRLKQGISKEIICAS